MEDMHEKAITRLRTERRRLEQNLARLSAEEMNLPGVVGVWSVKDVLAHLAEWELMGLEWVDASRRGEAPPCPAPGFTWKQVDGPGGLNELIYLRYRECPLEEVLVMFRDVHQRFEAMVETLSDSELCQEGYFTWTGKNNFFNWVNGFGAHDAWAKKKIRQFMKAR